MEKPKKTCVKTRTQLAEEYGICRKTLTRWLKKNEISISKGLITPKEQKKIYQLFGKLDNVPK